nr:hypothetical protein CcurKRNrm1_p086 [Cryptomonas curvata]
MNNKNLKRHINLIHNELCEELSLFSNISLLDIIRTNNKNIILPEDLIILEEKNINKNMLFYPEKIIWILKFLTDFEGKKNQKNIYIKKIFEIHFSYVSKYYYSVLIWKNSKLIISLFLKKCLKNISSFFFLFLIKFTKIFFTAFKFFSIVRSFNFFLFIFYFYKINLISSQIGFYHLKNSKFKIQKTIDLFIYFSLQKRNYYKLITYSRLFLIIYYTFNKFNLKGDYKNLFNRTHFSEKKLEFNVFNFKTHLENFNKNYSNFQKILVYKLKKLTYTNIEFVIEYFQFCLLKIYQQSINSYLVKVKNTIHKFDYMNYLPVSYIQKNKQKNFKYHKNYYKKIVEQNLIYINIYLKYCNHGNI